MSDDRFSDPVEARKKAMDYLARREHGRLELFNKLMRFGFEPAVADEAIERLVDDGLQSDQRFADAFVSSRISQGKGPVRIRIELRERGLDAIVIDHGIDDAGEDWSALASDVRRRKFGPAIPSDFRDKARQMRFLQYRGFEPEQISAAVSAEPE